MFGYTLPARYADTALPHTWDVISTIGDQELVGRPGTVGASILSAAWFSFRIATGGFEVELKEGGN